MSRRRGSFLPSLEPTSRPEYNTRIRELPTSERPRERLRDHGPQALSNAELLAIVLRSGSARQSVLNLASSLLARHGGLGGLARLSFSDLVSESGIGEAKAAEIQAAFQLALRLNALQPEERPYVRSPADVNNLLGAEMALLDQEHLRVMLINTRNQVMAVTEVYIGNVSSSLVRTAEVSNKDAARRGRSSADRIAGPHRDRRPPVRQLETARTRVQLDAKPEAATRIRPLFARIDRGEFDVTA